jgi:iron(III) transport system ATP-binding protein
LSYVQIEGLSKSFGATKVIEGLDMEVRDGEFLVLLGPSGCGKTTTLRCLAGLEAPTGGRISLGGETVFDRGAKVNRSPDKRSIGMVFQSYALWPHMTVRKNIAYPLKARGLKDKLAEGWVEETARLVDCEPLLDRYPAQLSGGQQQRVALARGLVARPGLVLFDEPLSNLDARLRDQVRAEIHELHSRLGYTAVFVTHDQAEAFALGDRVAIMRAGTIEQFDTPQVVFERPATEYVADFVGMSNRLVCERRGDGWFCNGQRLAGEPFARAETGTPLVARLRPEDLRLAPAGKTPDVGMAVVGASVLDAGYGGRHVDVIADAGGARLHARVPAGGMDSWIRTLEVGDPVAVGFRPGDARLYDESGQGEPSVAAADRDPAEV